ncbi:hypothetical protein PAXRUDRAFT_15687 [Paxillus rubicundulus Ve08.2h10]|uniref:Sacsin/Nov domain-containing protein n=1 Tax=Paxillus rubicundulus Ve08.2h10 TaxID=930991 RepID=A0A0D0DGZ8_9AGAM|nr:hypothetical protein PAXRUDRAFT_15687 [Paxillus rubicundulus Ve08.2h10]
MNANYSGQPTEVTVSQRSLVEKVLARYPEEFTVFRELVQNADDAGAKHVEIEFNTKDYSRHIGTPHSADEVRNGTNVDLNKVKVFKWVVRNDGDTLKPEDWERLTNIAVGNPDDQKIGTFGVGFFSVFSVTERPAISSGGKQCCRTLFNGLSEQLTDRCMRMYYNKDQLMVQHGKCRATKWTMIEMEVNAGQLPMPKPFDLSRFLCTSVTFLANVEKATILFNGRCLSEIIKSRCEAKIINLPKDLKAKRDVGFLHVESVQMIPQEVQVNLTKLGYSAGFKTRRPSARKAVAEEQDANPSKRPGFFGGLRKNPGSHPVGPIPRTSPNTNTSVAKYVVYSAQISSAPPEHIVSGLKAATKKTPPTRFRCEAVHFSMDEHQRTMEDGDEKAGIGSVFRGVQALCGEEGDGHGSRLFIGQSTLQTSGSAIHLSGRFVPTVERGSIDLVNCQVAEWNAELLFIGGLLMRVIYETAMKDIRSRWEKSSSLQNASLRDEALYTMKCFTFVQSTPDSKVGELLQDAFFKCSASQSFPILSNLGIRDSKDVREPHADFQPFIKEGPILDDALWPVKSTIIEQLPKEYRVTAYRFRDVHDELKRRALTEQEMVAFIRWWLNMYDMSANQRTELDAIWRKELLSEARFYSSSQASLQVIKLSAIEKFVDPTLEYFFLQDDHLLPPNTIPLSFTRVMGANRVVAGLGWERLTIVDWITYLISPGVDPSQDILKVPAVLENVFAKLGNAWSSELINDADSQMIIARMRSVACIPTNKGYCSPPDAYFPEADLFNELPVLQWHVPPQNRAHEVVLEALGVKRYLEWHEVENRLVSGTECSIIRLVDYIEAVRPYMGNEFKKVEKLRIFASDEGTRHCIRDLHCQHPINRTLGLPVLGWDGELALGLSGTQTLHDVVPSVLYGIGFQGYPSLGTIIEKASDEDSQVRQDAYDFFVENLHDLYKEYNPADFPDFSFLPCGNGDELEFGTPEEVFTSPDWEIFGFRTIHKSVTPDVWARLKVKQRPSKIAIIEAMGKNPPTGSTAKKWFEQAARTGFSSEELAKVSNMQIVPVQFVQLEPFGTEIGNPQYVAPNKCFYDYPGDANAHHELIFAYVHNYGEAAINFLKKCGAKSNPDCSDLVQAMTEDPGGYLQRIETWGATAAYKRYLGDLRQVAAGYHTCSTDLRDKIKDTAMFISLRGKARSPGNARRGAPPEYALKYAQEVLIADDLESHRSFGEGIFVAPKEEVFEKFYREHGSESLSAHVEHVVSQRTPMNDYKAQEIRLGAHVMERLEIFLHDQDSTRRPNFDISQWRDEGAFTVKFCESLMISKTLRFKFATQPHGSRPLAPICEQALAGIESTEGNYILWVKRRSENSKNDSYDVAAALCRSIFTNHKTHDTLLLMTILDTATLEDLECRGYDVDAIRERSNWQVQKANPNPRQFQSGYELLYTFLTLWFTAVDPEEPAMPENNVPELPPIVYRSPVKDVFKGLVKNLFSRTQRNEPRQFTQDQMDNMVSEALRLCESDTSNDPQCNQDKSGGGKKQRDVSYCHSRRTDLEPCGHTKNGMPVFKTCHSGNPPEDKLNSFCAILEGLRKLFGLDATQINIFWKPEDVELMGFNRNKAIYLNLAHYSEKRTASNSNSFAATYVAWYFVIAHEIAHNLAFFHDEDHELLFSSIAQRWFIDLKQLVESKGPNTITYGSHTNGLNVQT